MKPDNRFISADHAIEYWRSQNYSYERIHLPKFAEYDSAQQANSKLKSQYDHLLLAQIGDDIDFYDMHTVGKGCAKNLLSNIEFITWLQNWYYDDDLILQSNNVITVFHHSGFIFYLRSNNF